MISKIELNFDTEKYPLGRLTAEQIQKGYRILNEIQNVLMQDAKESKLIELTNEFYTNIPQVIFQDSFVIRENNRLKIEFWNEIATKD